MVERRHKALGEGGCGGGRGAGSSCSSWSPPQRFSMEGISSILQSSIRQTFGSPGTDKQVRLSPWSLPSSQRSREWGFNRMIPALGQGRSPTCFTLEEEERVFVKVNSSLSSRTWRKLKSRHCA